MSTGSVFLHPGGHRDVEVERLRRDPVDRTLAAPEPADDDLHHRPVVVDDLGDVAALDVLVARRGHLQRRRQVRPELEAVHPPRPRPARHLLVQDPRPRGHPLHRPRPEHAAVAERIRMLDRPVEHVGDRLDPPVRMPRKAGGIGRGVVVAEVVEQEERVALAGVAEAEDAVQLDAGALDGGLGAGLGSDGTKRHFFLLHPMLRPICARRRPLPSPAGATLRFHSRPDRPCCARSAEGGP